MILYFDLNKTILAIDEVKGFGHQEIVTLETWKDDAQFLNWVYREKERSVGFAEWKEKFQLPKNEPELIAAATRYLEEHPDRKAVMAEIMAQVHPDNSTNSFWAMLEWVKQQYCEQVVIVFRTFGTDLPKMMQLVEAHGFGEHIVKEGGHPLMWSVIHQARGELPQEDVIDGHVVPWTHVPGPLEKHTEEFKRRTVVFEEQAAERFKKGEFLQPFLYTGVQDGLSVDPASVHDIGLLPQSILKAAGDRRLAIMGIQDNYKVWSRKNPLNGKPFVLHEQIDQLFFDDYIFARKEEMGAYITTLYEKDSARPVNLPKSAMEKLYSLSMQRPCLVPVTLIKQNVADTAVTNPEYFIARMQQFCKRNEL